MMIKTTHNILASVILVCGLALAAQGQSSLTLPTQGPLQNLYDVQSAKLELMGVSLIRRGVADFQRSCAEVGDSPQPRTEEVVQLAGAAGN